MNDLPPEDALAGEVALWHFANSYPYLAAAVLKFRFVPGPDFAADTSWRIYVPPGWLASAKKRDMELLLWRALWPLLMSHWKRGEPLPDKKAVALASLIESNEGITSLAKRGPNLIPNPESLGLPYGSILEEIYSHLEKEKSGKPAPGSGDIGDPAGDHEDEPESKAPILAPCSGNTGSPAAFELPPEQPRDMLEAETAALKSALLRGSLPGNLRERITAAMQQKLPPLLQALIVALTHLGNGLREERRLFNRRQPPNAPVLIPGHARTNPEVHVILDSSASMDTGRLRKALGLVARIAREADVTLHVGDTQVQETHRRFTGTSLEVVGRGGTSMASILREIERLRPRLAIVITDGETDWPREPLNFPVVALILVPGLEQAAPKWIKHFVV